MLVLTDDAPGTRPPAGSVVTIGAYDGVHLGHRAVIDQVRRRAEAGGHQSAVVTFDRHPASVVRPDSAPRLLTDTDQKLELLAETGIDVCYLVHFDEARSKESAEDFVAEVLVGRLGVASIVVGSDFHFGHRRSGNVELLATLGATAGFSVEPLQLIERPDGVDEPISSTAIRRALVNGDVAVAAHLLGRHHEVRGIVRHGDERGRTIGFPTANVHVPEPICLPGDGVYAGWYERPDGVAHPCAINLGRRPTFYADAPHSLLEAHLLDVTDVDLYDEPARVRFVAFLRSERRFDGLDALRAQLALDIDAARRALSDER